MGVRLNSLTVTGTELHKSMEIHSEVSHVLIEDKNGVKILLN